jgi:hypothetical protein
MNWMAIGILALVLIGRKLYGEPWVNQRLPPQHPLRRQGRRMAWLGWQAIAFQAAWEALAFFAQPPYWLYPLCLALALAASLLWLRDYWLGWAIAHYRQGQHLYWQGQACAVRRIGLFHLEVQLPDGPAITLPHSEAKAWVKPESASPSDREGAVAWALPIAPPAGLLPAQLEAQLQRGLASQPWTSPSRMPSAQVVPEGDEWAVHLRMATRHPEEGRLLKAWAEQALGAWKKG